MTSQAEPDGLQDTGERMVPEFHTGLLIYAEHLSRYEAALPLVSGRVTLDIASGAGYGSHLLASGASHVYGVDLDPDAVAYAKQNFVADNLEFLQGDATAIPLPDDAVDVVITFETIEHVEDYVAFIREIKRVLRPGGIAVVSTPNDIEFAEGNHFHLHEFVYDELLELLSDNFAHTQSYFQGTWRCAAVADEQSLSTVGALDISVRNLAPLTREQFLYFYVVCSDEPIEANVKPALALGAHHSDRQLITDHTNWQARVDHLEQRLDSRTREHDTERQRAQQLQAEVERLSADVAILNARLGDILNLKVVRAGRVLKRGYGRIRRGMPDRG